MTAVRLRTVLLASVFLSVPLSFATSAGAQRPPLVTPPNLAPGPVPRTADGKPDLSGIWELPFDLEAYFPRATLATTEPVGFMGGMPPYQPAAAAKVKELATKHDPVLDCLPWGILRQIGIPFPTQFVQTPGQLVVLYEYFHSFRVIPTDGRKHPDDLYPTFMGDSVGRWEGDTLVVDVIGFNDKTWLGEPGTFHSEELHVVERYRLLNANALQWEATAEDPQVLTGPWKKTLVLRQAKPGTRIIESICTDTSDKQHMRDEPKPK